MKPAGISSNPLQFYPEISLFEGPEKLLAATEAIEALGIHAYANFTIVLQKTSEIIAKIL